jgi:xylan 1,4-beta-xylosidase
MDADRDILRSSGKRWAEQLRDAVVPTTERVVTGSAHGFLNEPASPHFRDGALEMARWMRQVDEGVRAL